MNLRALLAAAAAVAVTGCSVSATSTPTETPAPSAAAPSMPDVPMGSTLKRLKRLDTAQPTDDGTYDRDKFGYSWPDLDGDGCDTRQEILARDLEAGPSRVRDPDDPCVIRDGILHDPYTGKTIEYHSDLAYSPVQIDHVYPLAHAWRMGASEWSERLRVAFANDPRNLLAVDSFTNAAKGDSGPGEWLPVNRNLACVYGKRYVKVASAYDLPVTPDDQAALKVLLPTCR